MRLRNVSVIPAHVNAEETHSEYGKQRIEVLIYFDNLHGNAWFYMEHTTVCEHKSATCGER